MKNQSALTRSLNKCHNLFKLKLLFNAELIILNLSKKIQIFSNENIETVTKTKKVQINQKKK